MKKFNFNCILAGFAAMFILTGIWGSCFTQIVSAAGDLFLGVWHLNGTEVKIARKTIDKVTTENLAYHDLAMDIDSLRNNLIGTRYVEKKDTTIVKADSGSLCSLDRHMDESDEEKIISSVRELKKVSEENGAAFLYCAAPKKNMYEQLPENAENDSQREFDRLISILKAADIPVLNIQRKFEENGITAGEELFYYSDHHWRTYSGFLTYTFLCQELSSRYGFVFDEQYTDVRNYTRTLYPDWFLGSAGKLVGRYFSAHGIDDYELITPNFETNMTEIRPFWGESREGTFEEAVLVKRNLEKDYYRRNPYAAYLGGNYYLEILKNNLNPDGKKILLVRDSYSLVVAPFLALQAGEVHLCDMRDLDEHGEKVNLREYIREIKPDYVIVLYGEMIDSDHRFDFF